MYRKPKGSVIDRHVLIELDGDFTDQEIGHLLRKAYENHKAPHEYDDLKKYIRDAVIGKHNSVYLQAGNPTPLAAAAVLMPSNTLNNGYNQGITYDVMGTFYNGTGFVINPSCGDLPSWNPGSWYMLTYSNGNAIGWAPVYTTSSLQNLEQSPSSVEYISASGAYFNNSVSFYSFPSSSYFSVNTVLPNNINPTYLYAAYQTSTNPLTLSTYYYWVYPSSWKAATYSYVYFNMIRTSSNLLYTSSSPYFPTFYSTGTFSFSPGTAYITMWQWTYT